MDLKYTTGDEREALYNEVWAEPVTIVAKRYNMSDNGLRKHCKRLGIPLPPRGYWERIRSGQKVTRIALPKVTGELKNHVRNYVIKYKADTGKFSEADLRSDEELSLLTEDTKKFIKERCSQVKVNSQLRNPQTIITEHKEETIYRKKRDKELKHISPKSKNYEVIKSKFRGNKSIFPIHVSDSNINRAYRIIDAIINTLSGMEGHIKVGNDSGNDIAYFYIMHTAFYCVVNEGVGKAKSSKDKANKQSCLVLSFTASSWLNSNIRQKIEYKDSSEVPLETQLGKIIYEMFVIANKFFAIYELMNLEEEKRWEENKRKQRVEQMRKGELEDIKLLEQASQDWDKAQKIRRFADCMEVQICEVADTVKRLKLTRWLKWARDKADWLDPLVENEDRLLGKSQHIFDLIEKERFE